MEPGFLSYQQFKNLVFIIRKNCKEMSGISQKIVLFALTTEIISRIFVDSPLKALPMTPKTKTIATSALFLVLAVLFYLPISIPHKLVFPVGLLFIASIGLTPWQICAALFFSALGDWFGTCGNFLGQMGSFAVAHVFYIVFFVKRYLTKVEHDRKLTLKAKGYLTMMLLCVAVLLAVVFTNIVPLVPAGVLRIGVSVYAVLISTMLLGGTLQRSTLYTLGAVLFVFSDFILAWNKFVEPVPYRNYLVLVSYFLAQWLLFVRSTPYRIASLRPFRF